MRNPCRPGLALMVGIAALSAPAERSLATPVDPEILERIGPPVINPGRSKKDMIEMGRKLFFEETFEGNGRTCGTCHPATNNFTIDREFIATLPSNDPLFVDVPGLEIPNLLRQGLILENLDGFERPGVMRGVPHNLGMPTSLRPDPDNPLPGPEGDRVHAVGWSGDGAPGEGSLRLFSLGAIIQHFPKSTDRVEGVDFRLPTALELDAMEAFMMSVGRQSDVDLSTMRFTEAVVEDGRELFRGGLGLNRDCDACHADAGAMTSFSGVNANFDTGTRLLSAAGPPDGGFGDQPQDGIAGFGDGTMNTPSLIEAADTPPYFHNNAAATLEEAIAFYASGTFATSDGGAGFGGAFDFREGDIEAIGAVLRTLNAMENIRYGSVVSEDAQRMVPPAAAMERVKEVVAETEDAIQVLTTGGHPANGPLNLYPDAVDLLEEALSLETQASSTVQPPRRNALLREAAALKREASAMMVE